MTQRFYRRLLVELDHVDAAPLKHREIVAVLAVERINGNEVNIVASVFELERQIAPLTFSSAGWQCMSQHNDAIARVYSQVFVVARHPDMRVEVCEERSWLCVVLWVNYARNVGKQTTSVCIELHGPYRLS